MNYTFELHSTNTFVFVMHEGKTLGLIQPDWNGGIGFYPYPNCTVDENIMWAEFNIWAKSTGLIK